MVLHQEIAVMTTLKTHALDPERPTTCEANGVKISPHGPSEPCKLFLLDLHVKKRRLCS